MTCAIAPSNREQRRMRMLCSFDVDTSKCRIPFGFIGAGGGVQLFLRTSASRSSEMFSRPLCVPGAVGAGVGTQHRSYSVRPCGPALLAVAVADGYPRGGCLPPL